MDNLESGFKITKEFFGLSGLISNVIGTAIVIFYCCTIRFFPAGLSVGDVLFCLCIFAIFGTLYIFLAGTLHIAGKSILILLEKQIDTRFKVVISYNDRSMSLFYGVIAHILIFFIACCISIQLYNLISGIIFWFTSYITIFIMCFMEVIILKPEKKRIKNEDDSTFYLHIWKIKISIKVVLRIIIFFMPMAFVFGCSVYLVNMSFSLIGVRQSDVTIYLDKNYQDIFDNYEKKDHFDKMNCSSVCQLDHINILMTNIGTKTKFQIPAKSVHNKTNSPIEFEVPNEAIKGVRS
ncbi:hypothetical protein [Snodgrassella gandavensis]|uniref:hypothetical protein n=1 Tax=Snodgrassella gandavensis TaxID=2946698 RepID=UPI001EF4DE99|nr:hypothetical protein [Snodgrassella gandavensis]